MVTVGVWIVDDSDIRLKFQRLVIRPLSTGIHRIRSDLSHPVDDYLTTHSDELQLHREILGQQQVFHRVVPTCEHSAREFLHFGVFFMRVVSSVT